MIEIIAIILSIFFTIRLKQILFILFEQFTKNLTRFLGETCEISSGKFFLKTIFSLINKLFHITFLMFVIISPFGGIFFFKDANLKTYSLTILMIVCFFFIIEKIIKSNIITSYQNNNVSLLEKVILYFFYFDIRWAIQLSKISYLFSKRKNKILKKSIFIISVARSGTTALSTIIMKNKDYGGLNYGHLPFSLTPEWSIKITKRKNISSLRQHLDKNYQDLQTMDSLDEPMMFYLDHFFKDDKFVKELTIWHERIAAAQNKNILIFKNNNNYKRLERLIQYEKSFFVVAFRDPIKTAISLLENHIHFIKLAKKDNFFKDYLLMIRHLEFGPHHKSQIHSNPDLNFDTNSVDYWLKTWIDFAENVLFNVNKYPQKFVIFCSDFEITTDSVDLIFDKFKSKRNINKKMFNSPIQTTSYNNNYKFSENLKQIAFKNYFKLKKLSINA